MSSFWAAVASERALVIAPDPGTHALEAAYEWRSFNATAHENYTGWNGGPPAAAPVLWTPAALHFIGLCRSQTGWCCTAVLLLQCRIGTCHLTGDTQGMGGVCMQTRACWPSAGGTGAT